MNKRLPRSPLPAGLILLAATGWPAGTLGLDLVDVVTRAEKSVVRVDTDRGFGSGALVGDGSMVVTNFHVIEGAKRAHVVVRSGATAESDGYLVVDPEHDLAVLKVNKPAEGVPMKLAAALPKVGEKVAAFGSPIGLSFSTSEGIVSSIRTGHDLIGIMGGSYTLAPAATWIQTTAPISQGNSGGPLTNMNAELVGLNTMCFLEGQNLNFAISLIDVKRALAEAGTVDGPTPLRRMPGYQAVPNMPRKPNGDRSPYDVQLTLPNGRVFSFDVFAENARGFNKAANATADDAVVMQHPNGKLFAAAFQQAGVLHGVTLAQWENEQPMVYATYAEGKRHGLLKTWNEAGEPVLFGQYVQGRKQGYFCFFEEGDFRLLTLHKNDKLEWAQLVAGLKPQDGFATREKAEANSDARELLRKQDEVETSLKANEVTFRKSVMEFEKSRRRALAIQLGPEKRAQARERRQDKEAQNAAVHGELMRRFLGK